MSAAWSAAKRISHALIWLVALGAPLVAVSWAAGEYSAADYSDLRLAVVSIVAVAIIGTVLYLWIRAVLRCWPLRWAVLIVLIVGLPLGLCIPLIVTIIGSGLLIIRLAGRGGTLAPSGLSEPETMPRPRGLVESTSDE